MASAVVVSGLTVTTSEPFCWSNTLTCMGTSSCFGSRPNDRALRERLLARYPFATRFAVVLSNPDTASV